jgi:hypothetical protein
MLEAIRVIKKSLKVQAAREDLALQDQALGARVKPLKVRVPVAPLQVLMTFQSQLPVVVLHQEFLI